MLKIYSSSYYNLPAIVPTQYKPVDNYLVTNYDKCPQIIKTFVDNYYKKYLTKTDTNSAQYIICNIITQKFVEEHPDAIAVVGYYNEPGKILFARHAWISYEGIEYDLRAITERKYFDKSPGYTKVIKVKETPGSNLTEQKDIYKDTASPIDDNEVKYFSKCLIPSCIQEKFSKNKSFDSMGLKVISAKELTKKFSLSDLDLYGSKTGKYEPIMVLFLQDGNSYSWFTKQLPQQFRDSPLSEIISSKWYNEYQLLERRYRILLVNRYHPQFNRVVEEYNKFLNNNF